MALVLVLVELLVQSSATKMQVMCRRLYDLSGQYQARILALWWGTRSVSKARSLIAP